MNEDGVGWVEIASVVIAVLALCISIFQVRWAARESRYRTTFEHLRAVTEVLQRANRFDLDQVAAEYLGFFRRERDELTPGAVEFAALLTELDLLCLAMSHDTVDGRLARTYLSGAIGSMAHRVQEVIAGLRASFNDPTVFLELGNRLPEFSRSPASVRPR